MNYEILIFLFILFSVISSIINKIQEHRRKQGEEEPRSVPPYRRPPAAPSREREIGLPDWEVFSEAERAEPEEFREVEGKRPVTETPTGEDFREVRGTRQVEEEAGGEEFREVEGRRPVTEVSAFSPGTGEPVSGAQRPPGRSGRKRRTVRLDFKPNSLRKAIIFNEILGPPRGEQMD